MGGGSLSLQTQRNMGRGEQSSGPSLELRMSSTVGFRICSNRLEAITLPSC